LDKDDRVSENISTRLNRIDTGWRVGKDLCKEEQSPIKREKRGNGEQEEPQGYGKKRVGDGGPLIKDES